MNVPGLRVSRIGALLLGVSLAACSRQAVEEPVAEAPAGPRSAIVPTAAQLAQFKAEGPGPTLRKLAAVDYALNYRMMQGTGLEQALGGEANAVAALKELGIAVEAQARGFGDRGPKMIKTTFTGEGMSSGFLGMGAGFFVGLIGGGTISALVSDMSDEQLARLNEKGGFKDKSSSGSYDFQVGPDGSLTQAMEFDVDAKGINGKVKMKSKMDACPDVDGHVAVEIEMDSAMSLTDKPGSGGHVHTQFKYERWVNDDAKLIDTPDGSASKLRVQMAGYENFQNQSVDVTTGTARGGETIFEHHDEQGFSIFHMEDVKRTQDLLQATEALQTIMAEVMLRGLGSQGSPWESGHCIDLRATSSPAGRTKLKPSTAFDLEAQPRVKSDASAAGGTVTATLTGGARLTPASGKVRADAKYGYTGPEKKDETASIAFESRSKRGVGRATLEFDTKVAQGYAMQGGARELHFASEVCNLEQAFTLKSDTADTDVTLRFEPSSRDGGRYTYAGTMTGDDNGKPMTLRVHGQGRYTVKYSGDVAVGIEASGPGTVEAPFGPQTGEGTEQYTLKPLGDSPCTGVAG